MHRLWIGLAVLAAHLWQPLSGIAGKPLLELKVGDQAYVGRALLRNDSICWLQSPDGRLTRLPLDQVSSFRKVSAEFRCLSVMEAREQLTRERQGLDVAASGSYVVAAPAGKARTYAALLDQVHREFSTFCSRRDFGLRQPEFPMIALIFPSEDAFAEYCRSDDMGFAHGLRGYYNPESNRIAFFEDQTGVGFAPRPLGNDRALAALGPFGADLAAPFFDVVPAAAAGQPIDANFRDTLVHEATHQIAFNMGLHTRVGDNPRWVVEGLAMIFERTFGSSDKRRINEERFQWFMEKTRKDVVPLKVFVAEDRPFGTRILDAYAESWALAYYLSERRPGEYAKYLQVVQQHDPLSDQAADQRIADFQSAFGKDIDWLQVEWLRYIDGLQ